jgi:hypothetical protein
MPLQKITLKPGVNRENTRYTNEGGYYESDKVRFRQGTPEKIGGWQRISSNTFLGVCRSMWNWVTLGAQNLLGLGTNLKLYIENGGAYYDVTPIRAEVTLTNPFTTGRSTLNGTITATATSITLTSSSSFSADGGRIQIDSEDITYSSKSGNVLTGCIRGVNSTTAAAHTTGAAVKSYTVQVTDAAGGYATENFVTFYGGTAVGGITISGEYQLTYGSGTTYTILSTTAATSAATGGGTVYAVYQIDTGPGIAAPLSGWGASTWGSGTWGIGASSTDALRIWNQNNFGEDLLYGPRGGPLYYWNASIGYIPATVTISIATPCVVSTTINVPDKTAITLQTTGALPTGLVVGTVYYTQYLSSTSFFLSTVASPATATITAVCSGSGTNTLTVTAIGSVPLVAGMTVFYSAGTANMGVLSFTGTGTGGVGTYSVSAGTIVASSAMTAVSLISTSGSQSGTQYLSPRGIAVSAIYGATSVPLSQNYFLISDVNRFVLMFGTNDVLSTTQDPMLIRWSDQESFTNWYPSSTNQAGSVRLSHGSKIVTALQARQEIVVWTDQAFYSLQYLGPPYVWGTQLLSDNVSIIGPNAAAVAVGVVYWMGVDKFYKYDGAVQTLRCDLRQYIYSDINLLQLDQTFSSTNEGFNEVWFFYCSASSSTVNRYVVYNYLEDIWYYGTIDRSAWLDTGLRSYPLAATYSNNIVYQEYGVDNNETGTTAAIEASITSAQFDIGDGHNFAFVYRMIPDMTFRGSTSGTTPQVTMYLQGLTNSGSGITQTGNANVTYNGTTPSVINVDEYTGQLYIRVRGRQMQMKITSNTIGTTWQLGAPRIDIRPDGRR